MRSIVLSARDVRRFWQKIDKTGDCWNWLEGRSESGHGLFWLRSVNNSAGAHRVSYVLAFGAIPDGLWVLHRCHNALCVNPSHLYLGTNEENAKDRVDRIRRGITVVLPARRAPPSDEERFWAKVDKTETCWLWMGKRGLTHGGYRFRGKYTSAHRVAYMLTKGPIPEGLHVLHSCDFGLCMNPDHLHLGTHQLNMAEKVARNRQARGPILSDGRRGSRSGVAKLTEPLVFTMRHLYYRGHRTMAAIAREHGVHAGTAWFAIRGHTWTHVDLESFPVELRPVRRLSIPATPALEKDIVYDYTQAGLTQPALSQKYGRARSTIWNILHQHGISVGRGRRYSPAPDAP